MPSVHNEHFLRNIDQSTYASSIGVYHAMRFVWGLAFIENCPLICQTVFQVHVLYVAKGSETYEQTRSSLKCKRHASKGMVVGIDKRQGT